MAVKILVAGGSYGGLASIKTLLKLTAGINDKKFVITLVEPRSGFINIMAIPKLILDPQFAKQSYISLSEFGLCWDNVLLEGNKAIATQSQGKNHIGLDGEMIPRNKNVTLNFIQARITDLGLHAANYSQERLTKKITPLEVAKQPETALLNFDYCILASGRARKWPFDPVAANKEEFMQEVTESSRQIFESDSISVIGGGALGIEVAGEIKQTSPHKAIRIIHPHSTLPPEPLLLEAFKKSIAEKIKSLDIELKLNTRVQKSLPDGTLVSTVGENITSQLNLWCNYHYNNIGYLQNLIFKLVIVDKDELSVNSHLQLKDSNRTYENIFAIGDLAKLGAIKKAGLAFRTGELAARNIIQLVSNSTDLGIWGGVARKMAIVIGSKSCVQEVQSTVVIDSPKIAKSYKDYKNSKVKRKLGFLGNSAAHI